MDHTPNCCISQFQWIFLNVKKFSDFRTNETEFGSRRITWSTGTEIDPQNRHRSIKLPACSSLCCISIYYRLKVLLPFLASVPCWPRWLRRLCRDRFRCLSLSPRSDNLVFFYPTPLWCGGWCLWISQLTLAHWALCLGSKIVFFCCVVVDFLKFRFSLFFQHSNFSEKAFENENWQKRRKLAKLHSV